MIFGIGGSDPSEPTDGDREEAPSGEGGSDPSEGGRDDPYIDVVGNRTAFATAGPLQVYAHHDYPTAPWRSPLYVSVDLGPFEFHTHLSPESPLRPFSGGLR